MKKYKETREKEREREEGEMYGCMYLSVYLCNNTGEGAEAQAPHW